MSRFPVILLALLMFAGIARADDVPAWKKNAVAAAPSPQAPKIVIIIDDMGENRGNTRQVVALPGPLTLSYLPYPARIADEVKEGRAAGHEIMMHMPMEPVHADLETGDYFLTTGQTPEQLKAVLDKNLASFDGYVGINNHMGSRFTKDRKAVDQVMTELHARGLLFVDSRTIQGSVAAASAAAHHVPQISRDIFLDDEPNIESVKWQLGEVERIAREYGKVVAIGHPKQATIDALKGWLPTLAGKGFALVPVSAVVGTGQPQKISGVDTGPGSRH